MKTYIYFFAFILSFFGFSQETVTTRFVESGVLKASLKNDSKAVATFKVNEECAVVNYVGQNTYKIKYKDSVGFVADNFLDINDAMMDLMYDYEEKAFEALLLAEEQRKNKIREILEAKERHIKDSIAKQNAKLALENEKNNRVKFVNDSLARTEKEKKLREIINRQRYIDSIAKTKQQVAPLQKSQSAQVTGQLPVVNDTSKHVVVSTTSPQTPAPVTKQLDTALTVVYAEPSLSESTSVNNLAVNIELPSKAELKNNKLDSIANSDQPKFLLYKQQQLNLENTPKDYNLDIDAEAAIAKLEDLKKREAELSANLDTYKKKQDSVNSIVWHLQNTLDNINKTEKKQDMAFVAKLKQDSITAAKAKAAGFFLVRQDEKLKDEKALFYKKKQDFKNERATIQSRLDAQENYKKRTSYKVWLTKQKLGSVTAEKSELEALIKRLELGTAVSSQMDKPQTVELTNVSPQIQGSPEAKEMNNAVLLDSCEYKVNKFDKYYQIWTKHTKAYPIANALTAEVYMQGYKTSLFLKTTEDLGCAVYRSKTETFAEIKLQNEDVVILYHTWGMTCGEFVLKCDLTKDQLEALKANPLTSITIKGAKAAYAPQAVYNDILIKLFKCIE